MPGAAQSAMFRPVLGLVRVNGVRWPIYWATEWIRQRYELFVDRFWAISFVCMAWVFELALWRAWQGFFPDAAVICKRGDFEN